MKRTYSDYMNKQLADMIPARMTTFKGDDSKDVFFIMEVTGQEIDMIEIQLRENVYITFRLSDLLRAVESNRLNYSH